MEKPDKVIAGLECCTERHCTKCPYLEQEMYCMTVLEKDALELLKVQKSMLEKASEVQKSGDLISRSALIQRIIAERDTVVTDNHHDIGYHNGLSMAHGMAISAPAVEAEPVVHAHWVIERWNSGWIKSCTCSNCGNHPRDAYDPPKYCDNCGAHMDEEVSECETE